MTQTVRYAATDQAVLPGDRVTYQSTLFFWKKRGGVVTYVPGISQKHPEMEHDGLSWVGITGDDGTFRGTLVDPESGVLKRSVVFVSRGEGEGRFGPHDMAEEEW